MNNYLIYLKYWLQGNTRVFTRILALGGAKPLLALWTSHVTSRSRAETGMPVLQRKRHGLLLQRRAADTINHYQSI